MKLGPKLRKKSTELHEFFRKISVFIDHFLWLLFDPSKYIRIKNKEIKELLVVLVNPEMGNVGGDFCILGVINFFKRKNPNVNVSFLLDKKTKDRFGKIPGIKMIEYQGKKTMEKLKRNPPTAALFINIGPLKPKDLLFIKYRVASFYPSVRSLLIYKNKIFFTRKTFTPWGTHMVEFGFKMLEALGFKFDKKDVELYYSKEDEEKAKKFINKNKIKKYIIMHPGGKHMVESIKNGDWPPHLWPLDRYSNVADHLSKKGYKVIITGTKEESYLAKEIQKKCKSKIFDTCGLFSIRELGHLLKNASLLIATDTSIVHIAYQVKTKIVELIGPSYAKAVGAWPVKSPRHIILTDNGPCSRSMKKIACPEDIICLDKIKVGDVIKASEKLLKIDFGVKNFVFRADGGSSEKNRPRNEQGTGHITRSLILANHLRKKEHNVSFIMKNLPGKEIVMKNDFKINLIPESNEIGNMLQILSRLNEPILIIDKLETDSNYVKKLKKVCGKVITIDDMGTGTQYSDINIYPLYSVPNKSKNSFGGPEYVLFDDKLYKYNKKIKLIRKKPKEILVTLGGTDPTKTTIKVIEALKDQEVKVNLVIGPAFSFEKEILEEIKDQKNFNIIKNKKDLSKYLYSADLAILSGGITPYEAALLGTPSIVICHNLGELQHSFKDYGFSKNLGLTSKVSSEKIKREVNNLLKNQTKREKMSLVGKKIFIREAKALIMELIIEN